MSKVNNDEGGSEEHGSKKWQTENLTGLQDNVDCKETEGAMMGNQIEELKYESQNTVDGNNKLEKDVGEAQEKLDPSIVPSCSSVNQDEDLLKQNEKLIVLYNIRHQELENLYRNYHCACMEIEKLQIFELLPYPEGLGVQTKGYECVKTHYLELNKAFMDMYSQQTDMTSFLEKSKYALFEQMRSTEREERKNLSEEDALRRIKQLEKNNAQLEDEIQSIKEYQITAQKKIQKIQNDSSNEKIKILNKNKINTKLLIKRLKDNKFKKSTRKEIDNLKEQINALTHEVEMKNSEISELKEKERILQLITVVKECSISQRALETNEQEGIKCDQSAADSKLHLDKHPAQTKEAQQVVTEEPSVLEVEAYKTKMLQEGKREEGKVQDDEGILQKIKEPEELTVQVQKQVASDKQEEEEMHSGMENTFLS